MKKLSLSILLLLLGASNAQAFSLTQWTQQKVQQTYQWVKDNPRKSAAAGVTIATTVVGIAHMKNLSYINAFRYLVGASIAIPGASLVGMGILIMPGKGGSKVS